MRADAQRNLELLVEVARSVFREAGVDAPMRQIAERSGMGVGTIYRHFPSRSDLIATVFREEIDHCASVVESLANELDPADALERWLHAYADFILENRGLGSCLYSSDEAYADLPAYFETRLAPPLESLINAAVDAGYIGPGVDARDLLKAIAGFSSPDGEQKAAFVHDMTALLMNGLRYLARTG